MINNNYCKLQDAIFSNDLIMSINCEFIVKISQLRNFAGPNSQILRVA